MCCCHSFEGRREGRKEKGKVRRKEGKKRERKERKEKGRRERRKEEGKEEGRRERRSEDEGKSSSPRFGGGGGGTIGGGPNIDTVPCLRGQLGMGSPHQAVRSKVKGFKRKLALHGLALYEAQNWLGSLLWWSWIGYQVQ